MRAEPADFVNVNIGVDAYLDKAMLGIKGVEAQVLLLEPPRLLREEVRNLSWYWRLFPGFESTS